MRYLARTVLLVAVFSMLLPASVFALFITIDDGAGGLAPISVVDGDMVQDFLLDGQVLFIGSYGNFNVNVVTGLSDPLLPNTSTLAKTDLNTVNVSSLAAGTLELTLYDDGFSMDNSPPSWTNRLSIGGTTNGTVHVEQWIYDSNGTAGNTADDIELLYVASDFFSPTSYSQDIFSNFSSTANLFSMMTKVSISHSGAGMVTSLDIENAATVPEPTTLLIFGAGLLGIANMRRKRRILN